jgi:hypothetical protein
MFLKLIEILSKQYYSIQNKISSYLFVETSIITTKSIDIGYMYYYYLLNYYSNNNIECFINKYLNIRTQYNYIKLYEFSYRENGIIRSSILKASLNDIFKYTRINKQPDKLKPLLKCNLIINNNINNIRSILRKYDTKTKLYDIIYYNFTDETNNILNDIMLELGPNKYDVRYMNQNLAIEDA